METWKGLDKCGEKRVRVLICMTYDHKMYVANTPNCHFISHVAYNRHHEVMLLLGFHKVWWLEQRVICLWCGSENFNRPFREMGIFGHRTWFSHTNTSYFHFFHIFDADLISMHSIEWRKYLRFKRLNLEFEKAKCSDVDFNRCFFCCFKVIHCSKHASLVLFVAKYLQYF